IEQFARIERRVPIEERRFKQHAGYSALLGIPPAQRIVYMTGAGLGAVGSSPVCTNTDEHCSPMLAVRLKCSPFTGKMAPTRTRAEQKIIPLRAKRQRQTQADKARHVIFNHKAMKH